jgi:hypothetical protein
VRVARAERAPHTPPTSAPRARLRSLERMVKTRYASREEQSLRRLDERGGTGALRDKACCLCARRARVRVSKRLRPCVATENRADRSTSSIRPKIVTRRPRPVCRQTVGCVKAHVRHWRAVANLHGCGAKRAVPAPARRGVYMALDLLPRTSGECGSLLQSGPRVSDGTHCDAPRLQCARRRCRFAHVSVQGEPRSRVVEAELPEPRV